MIGPYQPGGFFARGGAWVMVQVVLMTAVILLGVWFRGDWQWFPVTVAGAGSLLAGGYFGVAGVLALGRNLTSFPRPQDRSQLVQHGIYACVRHPLYASVMWLSLGWAMIWQSAGSLAAALVLIIFFQAKARREERWLSERYAGYGDYARRVPRFIPRIGLTNRTAGDT